MIRLRIISAVVLVLALSLASYNRSALYQDKITLLTDIVAKSPNKARAHNNLGDALSAQDRQLDAIHQFLFAIQLNPYHADAHYNLGSVLYKSGRIDEAIDHYRAALELKPSADYHHNLGVALDARGKIDEAILHMRKALALKPEHAIASRNLQMLIAKKAYQRNN